MNEMTPLSLEIDPTRPSEARVYDFLLGGKDNFDADRQFARQLLAQFSFLEQLALDNRGFLRRAVRFLAEQGIRQFLDIGTGLPTSPNVHEVVQQIAPESRVVYVDRDPVVLVHARALLTSSPEGSTSYVDADARDVDTILDRAATAGLDFQQPVGLLFVAILHFLPAPEAAATVSAFQAALAPESRLVISHATEGLEEVAGAYQQAMGKGTLRTPLQIDGLFGGWEMDEPGLVPVLDWRPDPDSVVDRSAERAFLGGVARKPSACSGSVAAVAR